MGNAPRGAIRHIPVDREEHWVDGRNPKDAKDARETDLQPLWSIPTLPRILELAKIGMDDPTALSTEDVRNLARAIIYQYSTMGVK